MLIKNNKCNNGYLAEQYGEMDHLKKMSCHCLILMQCVGKFRAEGKILHGKPKVNFVY